MRKLSKLLFTHRSSLVGYRIVEELGVVSGSCCQTPPGTGEMKSTVENAVGGQLSVARNYLSLSVKTSMKKALSQAEKRGANCVVNLREQIATTSTTRAPAWWHPPATYYFAHVTGTAVKIEKIPDVPYVALGDTKAAHHPKRFHTKGSGLRGRRS
eukprot:TRINITY_DN60065_c0_g1_i1.p1 TRINITY_DN60065_c0_g1~~TRINITY_DN60065_c0_g1_i1.p1  ORF type:complete len:156 (+),score=51.54 TRINITY_DN60065_c0_g1_i1:84-551(+)